MPLQSGKGEKSISANIKELMKSWHKTGKIGTSTPKTRAEAAKQAAAIAYKKSGE